MWQLGRGAATQPLVGTQASQAGQVTGDPAAQVPAPSHDSVVHALPSLHALPVGSKRHAAEQQSPSAVLPSSHRSPRSTVPLPQANSYAPMSQATPCGRVRVRWSEVRVHAPAASMAGLCAINACVGVRPPLSASGAMSGSTLIKSLDEAEASGLPASLIIRLFQPTT